jgi:hypothetical protein
MNTIFLVEQENRYLLGQKYGRYTNQISLALTLITGWTPTIDHSNSSYMGSKLPKFGIFPCWCQLTGIINWIRKRLCMTYLPLC